jgi:hypothetical protein
MLQEFGRQVACFRLLKELLDIGLATEFGQDRDGRP